jgi:hypothetical protein
MKKEQIKNEIISKQDELIELLWDTIVKNDISPIPEGFILKRDELADLQSRLAEAGEEKDKELTDEYIKYHCPYSVGWVDDSRYVKGRHDGWIEGAKWARDFKPR